MTAAISDKHSPRHAQNPLTLSYRDKNLEQDFLSHYADESIGITRIGVLTGLLIFSAMVVLRSVSSMELDAVTWKILLFIIPILFVSILITYLPGYKRFIQIHTFIGMFFTGFATIYLITQVPLGNAIFAGYALLMLILVFNYLLLRLRFIYALVSGILISVVFLLMIYPLNQESVVLGVFNQQFFWQHRNINTSGFFGIQIALIVMINFSAAIVSYILEKKERLNFSQLKEIHKQKSIIENERKKSDDLLLNILPVPIAEQLKASNNTIADSFENVTVLFSDIVGFTSIANHYSAEVIVEVLNKLFSRFDEIVQKRGIEKIKTIGDAYMAVAGIHSHKLDQLETMADAALAMLSAANSINLPNGEAIKVRIGIHMGPAVAGVIGTHKFAYDLWGDTVNTASRMESHGLAGKIHVSETVQQVLGDKYAWEYRGEIDIKGKDKMRTWFLLYKI